MFILGRKEFGGLLVIILNFKRENLKKDRKRTT
jgi:hypothetical protein